MKQGLKFHGIDIIAPETMKNKLVDYRIPIIAIASGAAHIIREQLIGMDIDSRYIYEFTFTSLQTNPTPYTFFMNHMSDIEKTYGLLSDEKSKEVFLNLVNYKISRNPSYLSVIADDESEQYFDRKLIKIHSDEHFVDCGAYIGDTLEEFLKHTESFGKYFCFEADQAVYRVLEERVNMMKMTNIRLFNIGCWSGGGVLGFQGRGSGSSEINIAETAVTVNVDALDSVLAGEKISFVKMDIEGAEREALYGMKSIIKNQKPVLAISIYHSLDDFLQLPQIMHDMNHTYRIYIRHYRKLSDSETVCYAI